MTIDSGLSMSKVILAMKQKGVFGQALVDPRGNRCPVMVPGKYIEKYFANKQIGHCGMLEQVGVGVKFVMHCQNEE